MGARPSAQVSVRSTLQPASSTGTVPLPVPVMRATRRCCSVAVAAGTWPWVIVPSGSFKRRTHVPLCGSRTLRYRKAAAAGPWTNGPLSAAQHRRRVGCCARWRRRSLTRPAEPPQAQGAHADAGARRHPRRLADCWPAARGRSRAAAARLRRHVSSAWWSSSAAGNPPDGDTACIILAGAVAVGGHGTAACLPPTSAVVARPAVHRGQRSPRTHAPASACHAEPARSRAEARRAALQLLTEQDRRGSSAAGSAGWGRRRIRVLFPVFMALRRFW